MLLWTLCCFYLFKLVFPFSSDLCPGVELLDRMVVLGLIFWGTYKLFSTVAATITFPQQCRRVPFSSHAVQHVFMGRLLDDGHSDWCVLYHIVILIFISLIISNVEHLFMCLLAIRISSLEKCLFRSSAHFLIGLFVVNYISIKLEKKLK